IGVAAIDLRLVALRKSRSPCRAEVHPRISTVADLDLGLKLAVLALVRHPEEVAALAIAGDAAVADGPGFGILLGLPAIERFAVEHGNPVGGSDWRGQEKDQGERSHGRNCSAVLFTTVLARPNYAASRSTMRVSTVTT